MKYLEKKVQGRRIEFAERLTVLPSPESQDPSAPTEPDPRRAPAGRVLVVDDNADSAEMLATLLGMSGHDVRMAYSGPAALAVAAAHPPDVVLLDIGLPGIDGYEVARRLREIPQLGDVRIVAMTGYGEESDIALARKAGFDSHLTKPIDCANVRSLLATLMARQRHIGVPVTGEDVRTDEEETVHPGGPSDRE